MPKIVDKEEMQRGILDAAMRVFADKGYHSATIADIAKAAGLGKGTLYLYFKNKEALAEAMVERHFEAMETSLLNQPQPDTLSRFLDNISATMDIPEDHARFIRVFFEVFGPSFASEDFVARVAGYFDRSGEHYAKTLEHLQACGEVRTDFDARMAGRALASMIDGMMLHRGLFAIPKARHGRLRSEAVTLFLKGLRAS